MAKSFRQLLQKLPQERRERIEARAQGLLMEMALQELRQQRGLTQQQLADRLEMQQAAVSKMESQADIHLSTLRRIVAAMGGRLKLVATFPDAEVVINQFDAGKPSS